MDEKNNNINLKTFSRLGALVANFGDLILENDLVDQLEPINKITTSEKICLRASHLLLKVKL